jgi:hypothetical protein
MGNPIIFVPGASGTSLDLDPNTLASDYVLTDELTSFPAGSQHSTKGARVTSTHTTYDQWSQHRPLH